ncbi:MAG TPA: serine/threonine-protein kinase, partial [Nannocystaceae bacterium]|nr:serine/threonine-protein kinase [Nannocystaceae bacterium]
PLRPFFSPRPAAPPASGAPSHPSPPTANIPPEAPPPHALPLAAPPHPRPLTAAKRARTTPPPAPSPRPDREDTLTATPSPAAPLSPQSRERSLDRPPLHGVLADRYTIRARLDEGGEGVVYEAWDPLEHRPLALKVRSRLVGPDHLLLKREYQALAAVAHPNVARAFDLVEDPDRGLAFFTMELVQGVDIVAHVRRAAPRGQLQADLDRLRRAVRQIASGLQAIHATGRAHRDIKPSNILVTADGRAVIVDFGLAARLSGGDHLTLRARRVEGTPHYMAPEQLCADAPITPACDAYALGVVLYETLTGRWPLDADSLTQLITLKTYRRPLPPSAHVHGVPADLDALVARLLERDPDERATLTDLLAWCGDATHPHAPPPLPHRAPSPATTPLASHHKPQGRLAAAIRHLNRREPFTLLLHGPAGAGKSGLVRRVLTALRELAPQALILAGRCSPRESVPFRALDAILDALAAFLITCPKDHLDHLLAGGTAHLARLFPVFTRVPGIDATLTLVDPPASARERAFAELRALLHRLAAARPLVLTIDDLHRGDRDSLRLLDALTAPPDPPPLLLIATLRCTPEEAQATADALHGERELAHVRLPTADEATPVAYERLRAAGRDDPDLAAALACAC